jgi:hypothetical protein
MAKLNLTPSEFADFVASFILDKMINPDEIIIENEDFTKLIEKTSKLGAKPLFMKYYLDMTADQRLYYKRFKSTIEPGATSKSVIDVKPEETKVKSGSGLTNFAKKAIKMLLLQSNKSEEEIDILLEKYEEEILNG